MSDMLSSASPWERITGGQEPETDKAWNAFQIYRELPLHGPKAERRSYATLSKILEHASTTTIEGWARKYYWQERCRAYDEYLGRQLITVKQASLEEYKRQVVMNLSAQTTIMNAVINKTLESLLKASESDDGVDPKLLQQVVSAMEKNDNLARRAAGMPTTFLHEKGIEPEYETIEFTVGAE